MIKSSSQLNYIEPDQVKFSINCFIQNYNQNKIPQYFVILSILSMILILMIFAMLVGICYFRKGKSFLCFKYNISHLYVAQVDSDNNI